MAEIELEICNRALQKLGAARITSLSEDSKAARELSAAYKPIRRALLRSHTWNFAVKRFQLAADTAQPPFGRGARYLLPTGYLKLLPPDPAEYPYLTSWTIEDGYILSDEPGPLNVRCVMDVVDTTKMDPLFSELLAAKLALELCESLNQSNTKKQALSDMYREALLEARRANAFERPALGMPISSWAAARR